MATKWKKGKKGLIGRLRTYETIEEVTGRFSEFRGGCHLALLGIEYIPYHILSKFYKKLDYAYGWLGFVSVGEPKFSHVYEVINVPPNAIWNPLEWWALHHEIGHIIFDHDSDIGSIDSTIMKCILANKENITPFYENIVEITAEIIGFELGFFGDFDLYQKLLWNHLRFVDPYQKKRIPLVYYAIRTFFVRIFCGLFRNYDGIDKVSGKNMNDLDYLFDMLLSHITSVEKILGDTFKDKNFRAAMAVKTIHELYHYLVHLNKYLIKHDLIAENTKITEANTKDTYDLIAHGRISFEKINHPEAVLFKMLKEDTTQFASRIAFIITMANQHKEHFRERFLIER